MRLVFPGRDHPDANLLSGQYRLGISDECEIRVRGADWLPHHATLSVDPQRGLWLNLEKGATPVHVNARPIRECAMLRAGDIVSMGRVQFCVLLEDDPSTPLLPPRRRTPMEGAARIAASRAVLRGVAGWSHGHTFALTSDLLIGSAADADIRIESTDVAPHHARVELHGDRIVLRAEAPGNRLKVNGMLVENAILHPGDQIAIDPHRFVVEAPGLPPRGGTTPRQRPITQAMPAVPASAVPEARTEAAPASGGPGAWWLLFAAFAVAAALVSLLLWGPR